MKQLYISITEILAEHNVTTPGHLNFEVTELGTGEIIMPISVLSKLPIDAIKQIRDLYNNYENSIQSSEL